MTKNKFETFVEDIIIHMLSEHVSPNNLSILLGNLKRTDRYIELKELLEG